MTKTYDEWIDEQLEQETEICVDLRARSLFPRKRYLSAERRDQLVRAILDEAEANNLPIVYWEEGTDIR